MKKIDGHLFILVGPSGSGKSTIMKGVLDVIDELSFPVSATTRKPRLDEINGKDYYFLTIDEFEDKIKNNELLEYAHVHGETYYGMLKSEVIKPLKNGISLIVQIDYQGVQSMRKLIPEPNLHILYVSAGNWNQLLSRINDRGKLPESEISNRYQSFLREEEFKKTVDDIIDNSFKNPQVAIDQVVIIIKKYLNLA